MRRVTALGFGALALVTGCGDALLGYGRDSGEDVESSATYDAETHGLDARSEAVARREAGLEAGDAGDDASEGSGATTGTTADGQPPDLDAPSDQSSVDGDAVSLADATIDDAGVDAGMPDGTGLDADATTEAETPSDSATDAAMDAAVLPEAAADAGRIVLFGGFNTTGRLADTWLWDGTGWTEQNVSGPSGRIDPAAGTLNGQMVLFGGLGGVSTPGVAYGYLADTWVYDGNVWTQQSVSGPSHRWGAAAAALDGQVVLFGGNFSSSDAGGVAADTWTWDGTRWTLQNVPGPSARAFATATAWNGKVVLFGGNDGSALSDTWIWDGAGWTQQNVSGPPARYWACAASLNGKLVLFGGMRSACGLNCVTGLGDTWVWDGVTWTQENVSGPSVRYECRAATLNGRVVLFGGYGAYELGDGGLGSSELGDTWLWDGASWTQANVAGPAPRYQHVMSTL